MKGKTFAISREIRNCGPTKHATKRRARSFLLYCGIQAEAARHMHQYCDYQSERGEGELYILLSSLSINANQSNFKERYNIGVMEK